METLHELCREQDGLFGKYEALQGFGIGVHPNNRSQIVVVGNRSSGKSSVLEAISGLPFPVKGGGCTPFAIELFIRKFSVSSVKIKLNPGGIGPEFDIPFDSETFGREDLPMIIQKAACELAQMQIANATACQVLDATLRIDISGPSLPNIKLVDLPGLCYNRAGAGPPHTPKLSLNIAERYLKQNNSIVLAVLDAARPVRVQSALALAKFHDPDRERIMGIITKPDAVALSADELDYVRFAQNEITSEPHLKLGWHVVRNRNEQEIGDGSSGSPKTSDDERDEVEKHFLESGV